MDSRMMEEFILGFFIASLFRFIVLYRLFGKRPQKAAIEAQTGPSSHKSSENSVSQKDGGTDVVIVGAGDGRRVHVIERDLTQPDRIVGELLQPGGYLKLVELGMEDCVIGIDSQKVYGYALYIEGKYARLSYPLEEFNSDVSGRSFHHGRFIQRLREKAASLPNVKMEQGTVTSLVEENGTVIGVKFKTKEGLENTAKAPLTIVCDGCFSNLMCVPQVDIMSHFVGMVVVLENSRLPYPNHGHVILANPSPILFYPVSSTEVRCLVDIPGQKLPSISNGDMANYLKTKVSNQLPPELRDAFINTVEKGDIRTMPNRSMPAAPVPTPGAILLGDAFNMRHPLTGGGMTVALSDVVVLRDLLRHVQDFSNAAALTNHLESFYTLRKVPYTRYSVLHQIKPAEKYEECFDYLSLGGIYSQGPIALLSGLNPRPMSLVAHFFVVAIYGSAYGIIFPIVKSEGVRQMFFPITISSYNRGASIVMKSAMFDMLG
ncbi:unnamed protein product [Fraxinus pennsylvanica]|uniref:Squalene monooxygenase n=1 Tax=Fraxinus pennsylvanica TaxID=56036 RepID=A0AAD1Z9V5_9LAMI|nr:unnamed protein product [Fraxinus pennsylvanica]